jgi:ketosteroid isomerase-like protein
VSKVELLETIYRKPGRLFDHLHPDFTVHSPGNSPIAGTFHGADGMREHVMYMHERSGGSFRHDTHETYLADDNWGMVVHRMTGERNGMKLEMLGFGLWQFQDDLILTHWERVEHPDVWDRFWS